MSDKNIEMNPPNDSNKAPPPPAYHPPSQEPSPQVSQQRPPLTATQMGEQYRSELYARCAQGLHDPSLKFGVCGIILAVICFPVGLICLFLDTDKVCTRCGARL